MKISINTKTLLTGAGCAVLMTMGYTRTILSPSHVTVLFDYFPISSVFVAVLLDIVLFSLVAAAAWTLVERLRPTHPVWPIILAGILLLEVYGVIQFQHYWRVTDLWWGRAAAALIVAAYGLRWVNRRWFGWAIQAGGMSLTICGFYALVAIPYLAFMAVRTSGQETPEFSRLSSLQSVNGPRVVWILFDELSYDQTFEHRWPGLALSNFDALRAESISFTDVEPAGFFTSRAVPSMLLGRPVTRVRSSTSGEIGLYLEDRKRWEAFDAGQTVFADIRRAGWTAGIVGWSNPYCRFLRGWVDSCYWARFDEPLVMGSDIDPRRGVLANAGYPIRRWLHPLIPSLAPEGNEFSKTWRTDHENDYHLIMNRATGLINDDAIRFEFIHLPIPHPPVIYNRKAKAFSDHGSYVDNLALADLALGELLETLKKTPNWGQTTLIVSGDHSWRPGIWRDENDDMWTEEDSAASKEKYDPRPVLLLHLPSQSAPYTSTPVFHAIEMRSVINSLVQGRVNAPGDLLSLIPTLTRAASSPSVLP